MIDKNVKENKISDYKLCFKLMLEMKLYFFVIDDGTFASLALKYIEKGFRISHTLKGILIMYDLQPRHVDFLFNPL